MLPRWIWTGAWALAFVGGFVNAVGLLGFEHQAVTHLTGTTTLLATSLASLDAPASLHFLAIIETLVYTLSSRIEYFRIMLAYKIRCV